MNGAPMPETIVFYAPKSTLASILGVLGKMLFLGLPFLVIYLLGAESWGPAWLVILIGLMAGIVLLFLSDRWIAPLIGRKTTYVFDEDKLTIQTESGTRSFAYAELSNLSAFEVSGETSVKHISFGCPDGTQHDIFETWVTSGSSAAYDRIYHKYEGRT